MESLEKSQLEWEIKRTKNILLGAGLAKASKRLTKKFDNLEISDKEYIIKMRLLFDEYERMKGESE